MFGLPPSRPFEPNRWLDAPLPYPRTLVYVAFVVTLVAVLELVELLVG